MSPTTANHDHCIKANVRQAFDNGSLQSDLPESHTKNLIYLHSQNAGKFSRKRNENILAYLKSYGARELVNVDSDVGWMMGNYAVFSQDFIPFLKYEIMKDLWLTLQKAYNY